MTHVRTSPYYPQSNGKIERWHKSLKAECIRPGTPLSLEDALRLVEGYVEHYNNVRLNSAIGYITPKDMLAGHQQEIQAERDGKLDAAREQRKNRRQPSAGRVTRETDYFRLADYSDTIGSGICGPCRFQSRFNHLECFGI
jgi:putative transposase